MAAPFQPPSDIWKVNQSLQLDDHLDGDKDPRWVDTERARGEYSLRRLCRALGVDRIRRRLTAPAHGYYLFCGHRGCGKSTELRRIAHELHHRDFYYVVLADAAQELDVNNLRYQDVLLHLASQLMKQLADDGIHVDPAHLGRLREWFTERVEKTTKTRDLALEAKAGAGGSVGLPLLAGDDRFDNASAHQAVREMAADFRRILNPDDYLLLATIDAGHSRPSDSERVRYLLYNLALLEYNDYFWRSHPVIRATQEYRTAWDSLAEFNQ